MSVNIKVQAAASVAIPNLGFVQLFVDVDGFPKIKDNSGTVTSLVASAAGTAGGDLSGTYPNPTVVTSEGLKTATTTVSVSSATAPSVGQVLIATSSTTATWQTPPSSAPTGAAGGDLSGTYPNPTVTRAGGLKSTTTTVSTTAAAAPTVGQLLTALSATAASWQDPPSNTPSGPAGGDLSGTYPNPTVVAAGALRSTSVNVDTSGQAAPTAGQALIATSSSSASWQSPSTDLGGTWAAPTVVQARGLKTASGTVSVSAAAAPITGQLLTATSATTATWQTPVAYTRNSVWDPPLSTDTADQEFTIDPFLSGAWFVRDSGGTLHTRAGDVDPKTYPSAGTYRSTCLGSTVYFQTYTPITLYLYESVPSPTSGDQLWMSAFGQVASLDSSSVGSTIAMFAAADLAGVPDFNNNIVQVGLKNVNGTGVSADFWSNVISGGSSTDGFTFSDAGMAVSGMPGFVIRKGQSLISGSTANTINFAMFSPYGSLSTGPNTSPYSTSFSGSWAWAGFRITTDNNSGSALQAWGQVFALHFIRRKTASSAYIFG